MSKKIAQLTKVIFHLNSKNEDHQDDLAAVSDAYETEIDQILKDCASKVSKFKDKLEERKHVEREQTAVNQLLKQHEAEKKAAMEEFEKMRKMASIMVDHSNDTMKRAMEKKKDFTRNH